MNVYLPDQIGKRAKAAELNLSALLRGAVEDELARREAQEDLAEEAVKHELNLLDDNTGRYYTARFTGTHIAEGRDCDVYFGHDAHGERIVIVHDHRRENIVYIDDAQELSDWLDRDEYMKAMHALGQRPIVNL